MAVLEAVDDEAGGVDVPRLPSLAFMRRQERWPGRLDRTVGVELQAVADRLLAYEQNCLTLRRATGDKFDKIHVFSPFSARLPPGVFFLKNLFRL